MNGLFLTFDAVQEASICTPFFCPPQEPNAHPCSSILRQFLFSYFTILGLIGVQHDGSWLASDNTWAGRSHDTWISPTHTSSSKWRWSIRHLERSERSQDARDSSFVSPQERQVRIDAPNKDGIPHFVQNDAPTIHGFLLLILRRRNDVEAYVISSACLLWSGQGARDPKMQGIPPSFRHVITPAKGEGSWYKIIL